MIGIFAFGMIGLSLALSADLQQTLAWGLYPFIIGGVIKASKTSSWLNSGVEHGPKQPRPRRDNRQPVCLLVATICQRPASSSAATKPTMITGGPRIEKPKTLAA